MAIKNCVTECAQFLSIKIPGKQNATYTKHFEAGLLVKDPVMLGIHKDQAIAETFFVPADGKRGGGKRVFKTFPMVPKWEGTAIVYILDDTITKDVFLNHLTQAGQFIGVGRFRPRKNGFLWSIRRGFSNLGEVCSMTVNTDPEPLRPPYARHPEIELLSKAYVSLEEDGIITYAEVKSIIGVDPKSTIGRYITKQAVRAVLRDDSIVIVCLRNEGFKRVIDSEKVDTREGLYFKSQTNGKAWSWAVVNAADYQKLNEAERVQFTLTVSWLGAVSQATQPQLGKEIVKAIEQSVDVRAGDVLQLMIKKANKE